MIDNHWTNHSNAVHAPPPRNKRRKAEARTFWVLLTVGMIALAALILAAI